MWYAYDLFTDERFGPFATDVEAAFATEGKAVTIRYVGSRKRKS
jgi:hypothetical protein